MRERGWMEMRCSWRTLALWSVALFMTACSGSCGGGCDGFEERPFPEEHYAETMPHGAQVRVTSEGLDFVEQNVTNVVEEALPGGLSFCLPKETQSDPKLCFPYVRDRSGYHMEGEQSVCTETDGMGNPVEGCQIDLTIESTEIRPVPNNGIEIDIIIGNLNQTIPIEQSVLECDLTPFKQGGSVNDPATVRAVVPITFNIDEMAPTKDLNIDVGQIKVNLDDVDFNLRGGFLCGTATVLRGLVRGLIDDLIRDELKKVVEEQVRANLCKSCADDASLCPDNATCADDGICDYDNSDECVPTTLGIEGRLGIGGLIGEFSQTPDANVDVMFRMADTAEVDTGITLAGRTGFESPDASPCVAVDPATRPTFMAPPISTTLTGDMHPTTGDPFMVGVGVHERAVEHMLWSAWSSGALCLQVDSYVAAQISTATFGLLLPSLRDLADRESRRVELVIAPQQAPEVQLGANTVTPEGDSYTVEDPLLTLDWKDVDIHAYGWVQDRYTRIFTLRVDLLVPVAIVPNGMGQLEVALGDLEGAIENIRVRNSEILLESPDKIAMLVPTLVSAALPMLVGNLDLAFDLPQFFGLELAINDGDITSIDNNSMIAIFANFQQAPMMAMALPMLPEPQIHDTHVAYPEASITEHGVMRPEVTVDVGAILPGPVPQDLRAGEEVEFSWRVDGGLWSLFHRSDQLTIDSPLLTLPGEHKIEVRVRMTQDHYTTNRTVFAEQTVAIDYQPPALEVMRRGDYVRFDAHDLTTHTRDLSYRWRLHHAGEVSAWSAWSREDEVAIGDLEVTEAFRMEVEVRDQAGHTTRRETTVHEVPGDLLRPATGSPRGEPMAGCAVAPRGQSRAPALPIEWVFVLGGALLAAGLRRRRWISALLVVLSLGMGACSDDTGSTTPSSAECDPACADGESCTNGMCVSDATSCNSDAECEGGQLCNEGVCADPECTDDAGCADACGDEQRGVCQGGTCGCEAFCPDGCVDGTFCCYADNACQPLPDPCSGKVCDPGFEPGNPMPGQGDPQTCMVDGGACDCVPLPPLPLGYHGRYPSLAVSSDGAVATAVYNQTYGDLMVGVVEDDAVETWQFIDGVPADDADIVGALDGPRGGNRARGDNVGLHTASVYDDAGTLHVFYRSLATNALKWAKGTPGGEFDIVLLDDAEVEGAVGQWTRAVLLDGTVHVFYQVDDVADGDGAPSSELRHLTLDPGAPIADAAANATPEVLVRGASVEPCKESCSNGEVCVAEAAECRATTTDCSESCAASQGCFSGNCERVFDPDIPPAAGLATGSFLDVSLTPQGGVLVVYYDGAKEMIGWIERDADGQWSMPQFVGAPSGPFGSGMIDDAGVLHLTYMDPTTFALVYTQVGQGLTETIATGERDRVGEYLLTRIGQGVKLKLGMGGAVEVVYQDATEHRLIRAVRQAADSWEVTTLSEPGDPYSGAHGFYGALVRTDNEPIGVEYVIDNAAEEPTSAPRYFTLP